MVLVALLASGMRLPADLAALGLRRRRWDGVLGTAILRPARRPIRQRRRPDVAPATTITPLPADRGRREVRPMASPKSWTFIATLALIAPLSIAAGPRPREAAADVSTFSDANHTLASTATYWTPARLASAQPMPLPLGAVNLADEPMLAEPPESSLGSPGKPPVSSGAPDYDNVLFAPLPRLLEPLGAQPLMYGTSPGYRFTSARLTPDAVALLGAEAKYPNALNGQLFFKVPSGTSVPKGNYVCSATVQRKRIITTAGHCVSDGHGNFFRNWLFVPALRDGAAPFGTWTGVFVVVSNTWHCGGGGVPNAQDVASIELADNAGHSIWEFTGYAGYRISALYAGQHVTTNGYPCNIDNCGKIHRNDAQAFAGSNNTAVIGSDMRGGASGGGWIANWGEYGVGEPPASAVEPGAIRLVAVTSYGPIDTAPLYLGASILDSRYLNGSTGVLDVACAHRAGNC